MVVMQKNLCLTGGSDRAP